MDTLKLAGQPVGVAAERLAMPQSREASFPQEAGDLRLGYSQEDLILVQVPLSYLEKIAHLGDSLILKDRIMASGNDGPFGQFGRKFIRDGATVLGDRIGAYHLSPNGQLEGNVIPALFGLLQHQATEDRPERGKHRGALGHEFGTLAEGFPPDWHFNEEGIGENYDSRDGIEQMLIVMDELATFRPKLLPKLLPIARAALEYSLDNCERHNGWPAYVGAEFDLPRVNDAQPLAPGELVPGLRNHVWDDNDYSLVQEDGLTIPHHPITRVEVVAFAWAARLRWADRFRLIDPVFAKKLTDAAMDLEERFNGYFPYVDSGGGYLAEALDGNGKQIRSVKVHPLIAFSATYKGRSIVQEDEISLHVINRAYRELYDERGGFRTVSRTTPFHPENIYHGPDSAWPQVQSTAVRGIEITRERIKENYPRQAEILRQMALTVAESGMRPQATFQLPLELAMLPSSGGIHLYVEYDKGGKLRRTSSFNQAWAASAMKHNVEYLRVNGRQEATVFLPKERAAA